MILPPGDTFMLLDVKKNVFGINEVYLGYYSKINDETFLNTVK